ncbi:cytochrome P450 [Athelia psychrophila]|uniref:Cytochrome P450 n=1 Tax=Athelia psychrophila TaxID=1759441 RepID=A0A167URE5_9AGAM|nr:cytochrome P450 [Fibularhizoctonia sp. CBS 109695]
MRAGVCFATLIRLAGTDTTLSPFCTSSGEMSHRPDIIAKLQVDLYAAMPDPNTIPNITVLQKLPYFNAITKEELLISWSPSAWCSPQPLGARRPLVQIQQRYLPESFDPMSYALPPGTVVVTQAWSIHRDPAAHRPPRPVVFRDRGPTRTDAGAFIGSRICRSMALAMMTMPVAVAALTGTFEVVAAEGKDEKSMEPRDGFANSYLPCVSEVLYMYISFDSEI